MTIQMTYLVFSVKYFGIYKIIFKFLKFLIENHLGDKNFIFNKKDQLQVLDF